METSRKLRRAAYILGIVVLILLVAYGALAWCAYSSSGSFSTAGAEYPAPRIGELIWPTVGYPAMVTSGGLLEIEVGKCVTSPARECRRKTYPVGG